MDVYEILVCLKSWPLLRKAQHALFDLQVSLQEEGYTLAAERAFDTRLNARAVENILRAQCKEAFREGGDTPA